MNRCCFNDCGSKEELRELTSVHNGANVILWLCKAHFASHTEEVDGKVRLKWNNPPVDCHGPGDVSGLAVMLTINRDKKKLRLDFGKTVSWITMTRQQAYQFIAALKEKADKLDEWPDRDVF